MMSLSCLGEKEFQISSASEVTELLKPRSKVILKNLFFVQFKSKWSKIRV